VNHENGAYRTCVDGIARRALLRVMIDDIDSSVTPPSSVPPVMTLSLLPGRGAP
jgi:hypothetical protein